MSDLRRELHRLADFHGGELTPEQVVAAASRPGSPLHNWFEWRDDVAAVNYRLWQARALLNSFDLTYTRPDGTTNTVREFPSIHNETGERRYVPIQRVAADKTLIGSVIDEYDQQLRHFAERVRNHSDLMVKGRYQRVVDAIDGLPSATVAA